MSIFFLIIVTITSVLYCVQERPDTLEQKVLSISNPTSYVFNGSKAAVQNAIISSLGDLKYKGLTLIYVGSRFLMTDTSDLFHQPGNADDFFLTPSPSNLFPFKSLEYFRDSDGADYHASFHLHLTAIGTNRKQVDVITIDPKIIVGYKDELSPHLKRPRAYKSVEPTTVEEYEIL